MPRGKRSAGKSRCQSAAGVLSFSKALCCDNTISVNLEIVGDTVFEVPWWSRIHLVELAHALDPGWLLELWLAIHGGDPGPESKRLKQAEEHLEAASVILRELDESARLSGVRVSQGR